MSLGPHYAHGYCFDGVEACWFWYNHGISLAIKHMKEWRYVISLGFIFWNAFYKIRNYTTDFIYLLKRMLEYFNNS